MSVFVVAILHIIFFVLESILWTSPQVIRLFGMSEIEANATKLLAFNQGCYNLGASILLITFFVKDNQLGVLGILAYLSIMGLVGALTANWRIIIIQSLPATLAFTTFYMC